MTELKAIEAEATYQGLPCLSAEFTATPGLGPNDGSVVICARDAFALKIQVGDVVFRAPPVESGTYTESRDALRPRERERRSVPVGEGVVEDGVLAPFGDLVLRSTVGTLRAERLMPTSVEPIDQDDEGLVLYRIRLEDVRRIWGQRGALYLDANHYDDLGQPVAGVPRRKLSFTLKSAAAALPGVASTQLAAGAAAVAGATEQRDVRWRYADPVRELGRQLEEQDLHAVLAPDGETLRIYQRGEGKATPDDLGIDADYRHQVAAPVLTLVPDSVLVVGAARQREVVVAIGASAEDEFLGSGMVGLALESDDLLPWEAALSQYGMTPERAERWVLQKPETQAAMLGGDTERAERLRRWLFRWFRLPGRLNHTLPMLPLVERETGRELPIRVASYSFTELSDVAPAPDDDELAEINRRMRAILGRDARVRETLGEEFGLSAERIAQLREEIRQQVAAQSARTATGRRWANTTGVVAPEDAQVDEDAGIIRFRGPHPPGWLFDTSVETIEQTRLLPARVVVTYRHERKDGLIRAGKVADATLPVASSPDDHFVFALERSGADFVQVEPGKLKSAPLVIHAPHLVEIERLDGTSNRAELTEQASQIAAAHFRQPQVAVSYDVRAAGIWPVWPDGAVGQCRWRVSANEASTEVVINSYRRSIDGTAPTYAQKRGVQTMSRGDLREADRVLAARPSARPRRL